MKSVEGLGFGLAGGVIASRDREITISPEEAEQITHRVVASQWFIDYMRDVLYIEFVRAAEDIKRDAQDKKAGETVGKWLRARARLLSEKGGNTFDHYRGHEGRDDPDQYEPE